MDRRPLETGDVQELPTEIQKKWFNSSEGFARMGVNGEGSCFFHSVLCILNPHNFINLPESEQIEIANKFRCSFSKQFTLNEFEKLTESPSSSSISKSKLEKEFKKSQKVFCEPKVWADETNIRIVSRLLNLNIVFLDLSKRNDVYCNMHGEESLKNLEECDPVRDLQKTGIIAWIDKSHFEPIVRIDNAETGELTTMFNPVDPKDCNLLLHFMSTYKNECRV